LGFLLALFFALSVQAADEGKPVELYFFWSLSCPHCTAAHPHIEAMAAERPWLTLHALELTKNPGNVRRYQELAQPLGETAAAIPAFLFCGRLVTGWDNNATTGAELRRALDDCHGSVPPKTAIATTIHLPWVGELDPASLSLPALTLILAGLDAFNPCAFFVLLFLLSMMAHQKSRTRMLLIGGVFVAISGLMYFAFMAAWLSVFQLLGHLAWVTRIAGALAVVVGAINLKDYFAFKQGVSLSISEAGKADIFQRTRSLLNADRLPAMVAATVFLAIAANFYELLCTAGFPMVFTRLLTLADLSTSQRFAYLAAYNTLYVLPLAAIVAVFSRSLGARKLSEREGRLLKLMSGLMMLELGLLLLVAPDAVTHAGIAFGLMAGAVGVTWIAARRNQ
jgi:thiol-disulfide isomerase/thioredoxin